MNSLDEVNLGTVDVKYQTFYVRSNKDPNISNNCLILYNYYLNRETCQVIAEHGRLHLPSLY